MPEYGVFKVGDPVSVVRCSTVEALVTVLKIGPRKMTLSDCSEWRPNGGRPYGSSSGHYNPRSVIHRREGDELKWLRGQARIALGEMSCQRLMEADLRTLLEIAKRDKARI